MAETLQNQGGDLAVVNVTTRSYLYRTRTLFDSVAKHLPEARRIVCCADRLDGVCDPDKEAFEIVEAASLGIPRFPQWALALNPSALCCALKPHAIGIALKDPAIQRVIYIDNDMGLYRSPDEMLCALESASVVLTPHHLQPLPTAAVPNERALATYGVFNAGILGIRRCAEVELFLEWWSDWMLDPRHLENAMGYDQVWLNYVPVYCPASEILRDPAYNVAFWNMHERSLVKGNDGVFRCEDKPLVSFHFSNFSEDHPERLVWPEALSNFTRTEATDALLAEMVSRWSKAGRANCLSWGYGFSRWPDRSDVTSAERDIAKTRWDELPTSANPWAPAEGAPDLQLAKMVRPQLFGTRSDRFRQHIKKVLGVSPLKIIRYVRNALAGRGEALSIK
ncbi:MAG: hypothetical protein JHC52_03280 [Chthoniobacterales bacterium]|nr:hypothetical protein [Chthoniobacterales bacterium]